MGGVTVPTGGPGVFGMDVQVGDIQNEALPSADLSIIILLSQKANMTDKKRKHHP